MNEKVLILFLSFVLVTGVSKGRADTIILKTGEMFQTRKAWKENGAVLYYQNDRVVRVDERQVERLIHSPAPAEAHPPAGELPAVNPLAPSGPSAGQPLPQPEVPVRDETGYLGLIWGQAPNQIEGLKMVGTDPAYGGVQLFTRNQRISRFGRARVDNIFFGFWQEGLYTLLVEVSNYLDFTDLKEEVFRRYGAGKQDGDHLEKYRWTDPVCDRLLSYDDGTDTGYLWMRSRAMHAKVREHYPE